MRKMVTIGSVMVLTFVAWTTGALAQKAGAHLLSEPVCTLSSDGTTISCTGGSVAGLGNQAVIVTATAPAGCGTKPDSNNPPGHAQFTSEPIQPHAGRINLPSFTLTADCPPGLVPFIGTTVTYTITTEDGTLVFTFQVTAV
jgi:hypothetical protein